ncbi:hypothetical protein P153DRAFT_81963 [Dothidotthia symphoricarpi CBS 119687]|uniref:Uncharacterized protein n=1 Tax=Dothidotthia symphoricarpi CBS 119687 TaxID=1392245 RepID=A0A6A6A686_9PLEO|nr:uncharacterized protein P153DRAFT_81963 [Dothidotthia symphoricarpi CBS 119687]KAF2126663.1 hypothetical protein P153DRAFT_81963 [Dothidotthia symphoricarpi CBS 119687]
MDRRAEPDYHGWARNRLACLMFAGGRCSRSVANPRPNNSLQPPAPKQSTLLPNLTTSQYHPPTPLPLPPTVHAHCHDDDTPISIILSRRCCSLGRAVATCMLVKHPRQLRIVSRPSAALPLPKNEQSTHTRPEHSRYDHTHTRKHLLPQPSSTHRPELPSYSARPCAGQPWH